MRADEKIASKNAKRERWQRRGPYLLSLEFLAQAVAAYLT